MEREDFEAIMATTFANSGPTDTQRRLESFAETNELFNSIKLDKKALTRYCDLRTYSPNSTLVTEGEATDWVWFIR